MITVTHNGETITGSLNGKAYAVPFKKEWYDKLDVKANSANTAKSPEEKKTFETSFQNSLNAMKGASKNQGELKKEIKIGTNELTIQMKPNSGEDAYYLFNGKQFSKFYIPSPLYVRIKENESKDITTEPLIKFFILANRGEVMTQDKLNRLADYINKTYIDQEIVTDLVEQGYTQEKAIREATVLQVPITMEGLLNTYKVSTLISDNGIEESEEDEDCDTCDEETDGDFDIEDDDTSEEDVDITEFKFTPKRNSKGHFLKRGSDEYVAEYNKQLDEFKASKGLTTVTTKVTKLVEGVKTKVSVEATPKYAEEYVFQPAYQGTSGDAFYCGDKLGHIIQVGKLHRLASWSQVDTDDHTTACPGLHVGGRDYIKGYESENSYYRKGTTVVHNVFVDPQFVGAVVSVENGDGALRVKEYFVHSSFIGINGGNYNSSDYAKQTAAEWDANLQQALVTVQNAEAEIQRIKESAAKAQSIIDSAF